MTTTSTAARSASILVLATACFGCASRPAAPPRSFAYGYGPGIASQAAYGADLEGDDDDDDAALGFFARPRKKRRGASIPWTLPAGWALPGLPIPAPWVAPLPGKQGLPAPSLGAPLAVAHARSKLGVPYCWGGAGPNCYDCSGLTSASWKAGGKAIPRTSEGQAEGLPEVPIALAMPGDILWRPGHVALYIGDGKIIQAPHTGDVVKVSPAIRFVKALRP